MRRISLFLALASSAFAGNYAWQVPAGNTASSAQSYSVAVDDPTYGVVTVTKNGWFFTSSAGGSPGHAFGYSTDFGAQTVTFAASGTYPAETNAITITAGATPVLNGANNGSGVLIPSAVSATVQVNQPLSLTADISDADGDLESIGLRWQGLGLVGWWGVSGGNTKSLITRNAPATTGTFNVRAEAFDKAGHGITGNWFTVSVVAAGAVSTPQATQSPVSSITGTGFTATWNTVAGATGYRVDVSTSDTFNSLLVGYDNLDVPGGATSSLTVSGLPNNTTYYYRVRAYNATATSPSSNTIIVAGAGNGLMGEYFDAMDFTSPKLRRIDPTVNFDWGTGTPAAEIAPDTFTTRWKGQIVPRYTETYTFTTTSDDGIKLWINGTFGTPLIENWDYEHGPTDDSKPYTNVNAPSATLIAGHKYDVQIEYKENGGSAVAKLAWESPSQAKEPVPQSQLYAISAPATLPETGKSATGFTANWTAVPGATGYYVDVATDDRFTKYVPGFQNRGIGMATSITVSPASIRTTHFYRVRAIAANGTSLNSPTVAVAPVDGTGLTAQYFDNPDFTNLVTTRTDPTIDFNWAGSPATGVDSETFSVRWRGQVVPRYSETYTFSAVADEGARVWVNGVLVIDPANGSMGSISLVGGRAYDLQMDFVDNFGAAPARLLWSSTSQAAEVIPQTRLYPWDSDGDGLPDAYEQQNGLNPNSAADALYDQDGDGWTNVAEHNRGLPVQSFDSPAAATLDPTMWLAETTPSDNVGSLAGTSGVNSSGAATYSVPIQVSPGSVGVQPKLSLDYSSQAADGYLGLGWQLSGLSTITRGRATAAADGVIGAMTFSAQDKWYLDGRRLIAISGAYGADLTEYRTEIDSGSRIVSYGSAPTGPTSFKVWTKDGRVIEFGGNANSRFDPSSPGKTLIWAVNSISDESGNSIRFEYSDTDKTNGELLPSKIYYTCNSAAPDGYATVEFGYRSRVALDVQKGYAYDAPTLNSKLLTTITAKVGLTLYRQYRLIYTDGNGTRAPYLNSIQEAADDDTSVNSKAFPATSFGYFLPPASTGFTIAAAQSLTGTTAAALTADMNGDGLTDLVRIQDSAGSAVMQFYLNSGSTFSHNGETLMLSDGFVPADAFLTTDMDGDGKSEVIINPAKPTGVGDSLVRRVKVGTAQDPNVPTTFSDIPIAGYDNTMLDSPCYSADFTGDGRDDLLLIQDGGYAQLLVSNGTSYTATHFNTGISNGLVEIGDFTGDGVADVLNVWDSGNDRRIRVYTVSPSGLVLQSETILGAKITQWRTMVADVNGDGQLDLLYAYNNGGTNTVQIWLRTGNTFVSAGTQAMGGWNATEFRYVPFDYDGDRKTDIAIFYKASNGESRVQIWKASGPAYAPFVSDNDSLVNATSFPSVVPRPAQLDMDGVGDLVFVGYNSTGSTVIHRLTSKPTATEGGGGVPYLLHEVTNGFGVKTTFTYLSLLARTGVPATEVYTPSAGSAYPVADIRPAFKVVSSLAQERPGADSVSWQYSYSGLKSDAWRGLLGFASISKFDSSTNLETKTTFSQTFPTVGMPTAVTVTNEANGQVIRSTDSTLTRTAAIPFAFGSEPRSIYRPYSDTSYSIERDLDGTAARTAYSATTLDDYGNATAQYSRSTAGVVALSAMTEGAALPSGHFETKTVTQFSNDTTGTNWLVNRPTRTEVTATSGDFPTDKPTRVTGLEYWPGTSRVRYAKQEPDAGSEPFFLQTEIAYDSFGNAQTVTVSSATGDSAIATRTTTVSYAASTDHPIAGRFQSSATDALLEKTSFAYDWVKGTLVRKKDEAANLTINWAYDAFGRVTLETRPDNTHTSTARRWDSRAVPDYGSGSSTHFVSAKYHVDVRTDGGSPIVTRFNARGLPIQVQTVGGDSVTRLAEKRYDSLGNVIGQTRARLVGGTTYWTTSHFDQLARIMDRSVPRPGGYDVSTWLYSGLDVTHTSPRLLKTKTTVDALGQVAQVVNNPDFVDTHTAKGKLTKKYNGFGNLRETTDAAGNTVKVTYDKLGRKTEVDDPNMGKWSYAYYAHGLMRSQTDARNKTTTFTYDLLDRLDKRTIGTRVVDWDYNIPAPNTSLAGARLEQKVTVTDGSTTTYTRTPSYDAYSRPTSLSQTFGSKTYISGQAYDTFGRPTVTTYPTTDGASFSTINRYSSFGAITEVRRYDLAYSQGYGQVYWAAGGYEDDGQLRLSYLGNGAAVENLHVAENGLPSGDAVSIASPSGSAVLPALLVQSYGFDGSRNLNSRGSQFTDVNGTTATQTETFSYDEMNRLYDVTGPQGTTHTYRYDATGNIKTKDGLSFDYTRTNQAEPLAPNGVRTANGATYGYDANGNIVSSTAGLSVVLEDYNRPQKIQRSSQWSTFTYGAEDNRIVQTTQDGTEVRYVDDLYEVTVPQGSASLAEVRAYVAAPTGRVAVVQFGSTGQLVSTRYLAQDQLNSVTLVTDERGQPTERFSYDAWGAPRSASSWASTTYPNRKATSRGYTDHETLAGVQLVHMNGRVYDPALGRFLSPDPLVQSADGTQAINRFCYVRNNPASMTDPSGFAGEGGGDDMTVHLPTVVVGRGAGTYFDLPSFKFNIPSFVPGLNIVPNQSSGTLSQSAANFLTPTGGSLMWHSAMVDFQPADVDLGEEDTSIGEPGFWAGMIPVYGSGRTSINYFQHGRWFWGTVNGALAISDVFLVKTLITAPFKMGGRLLFTEAAESTISASARGNPSAILHGLGELSSRQRGLLQGLNTSGASMFLRKSGVSLRDLSALTAATGDEFLMLTRGSQRMLMRGGSQDFAGLVSESWARDMASEGWRLSGHTHPSLMGVSTRQLLMSSGGDQAILRAFGQSRSVIVSPRGGAFNVFSPLGDL